MLNALEQMEKIQELSSNTTVSSCSLPGSVLGAGHGSETSKNLCPVGVGVGGVERRKDGSDKYHKD